VDVGEAGRATPCGPAGAHGSRFHSLQGVRLCPPTVRLFGRNHHMDVCCCIINPNHETIVYTLLVCNT
jgi:hypothetical protein